MKKRTSYRINNAITIFLIFILLIFINIISNFKFFHIDITESMLNSLSESTSQVLSQVDEELQIHAFYSNSSPHYAQLTGRLEQLSIENSNIKTFVSDPEMNPGKASEYGAVQEMSVIEYKGRRAEVRGVSEERFVLGINRVLHEKTYNIYFLQGYGGKSITSYEEDSYSKAADFLKESGYNVDKISLTNIEKIPEDCDTLVIAAPSINTEERELDILKNYFDNDGSVFLLLDTTFEGGASFKKFAHYLGFSVFDGFLVDMVSHLWQDATTPVVKDYRSHFITERLPQTAFPLVRPIQESRNKPRGEYLVQKILESHPEESFLKITDSITQRVEFNPATDEEGPALILGTSTKSGKFDDNNNLVQINSRAVVSADATFLTDAWIERFGNAQLFGNIIDWLASDGQVITARAVDQRARRIIELSNFARNKIFYFSIIIIPVLIALFGILVIYRREKE
ncbi:MAG: Gldg family protein [Candidatus Muiribacteriota bacterium]